MNTRHTFSNRRAMGTSFAVAIGFLNGFLPPAQAQCGLSALSAPVHGIDDADRFGFDVALGVLDSGDPIAFASDWRHGTYDDQAPGTVFTYVESSPGVWVQDDQRSASITQANLGISAGFGKALALTTLDTTGCSGTEYFLAIGAPGFDEFFGEDAGALYVQWRKGTQGPIGCNVQLTGPLYPCCSDFLYPGDRFGSAVATNDTKILVGAPGDAGTSQNEPDRGEAWIGDFLFAGQGNDLWTASSLVQLIPSGQQPGAGARFGEHVAMSDDWILVSAPGENRVHVFDANLAWQGRFEPPAAGSNQQLGSVIAIDGDRALIVGQTSVGFGGSAKVYEHTLDGNFSDGTPADDGSATLVASFSGQLVGVASMDLDGAMAAIVAGSLLGNNLPVRTFVRTGGVWVNTSSLPAGQPYPNGGAVGLADGRLVVGSARFVVQCQGSSCPPPPTGAASISDVFCVSTNVCPPAGPPYPQKLYEVNGTSTEEPWSYCIDVAGDQWCSPYVEPVAFGAGELELAQRFADDINDASCNDDQLLATATEVQGTTYLAIRIGGTTPFDLWVGDPGVVGTTNMSLCVGSCSFNPTLTEIPLSGSDCNANGMDDTIDLAFGDSLDENGNGIPDECECQADLDASGDVGFGDVLTLIGAWGPCAAPCPFDLNGDGAVGFADILIVLAAWGSCP